MDDALESLAALAARLIVEEDLDFGSAKLKAARQLGRGRGTALPSNEQVEDAVREHLALFHADTQPAELAALRALAAVWMVRLAEFRPLLTGAVWRGTATRHADIHLALYCDDPKACEIALLNAGQAYEVGQRPGPRGQPVDVLRLMLPCPALGERVGLQLSILGRDDVRGALIPDARGRTDRGDLKALQRLRDTESP